MRHAYVFVVVIVVCTFLAYFNSLHTPFLFDDEVTIRGHKSVQTQTYPILSPRGITYNSYRGQTEPWHYHLVNVSLHAMNSALMYAIAGGGMVGLLSGLFFALHPIQTESVTYITGRAELLAAMFILIGAYLCQKNRPYIALALYPAAMLSKESAVIMPALCLAISWQSYGLPRNWRKLIVTMSVLLCCGAWWILRNGATGFVTTFSASMTYLHAQATVLLHYLALILWPTGQYQNVDPTITPTLLTTIVGVGVALLLSLSVYVKRRSVVGLGIAIFVVALLPTSTLVPIPDLMAEHRLYTPMIGVALVFGDLFKRSYGGQR